MAVRKTIAGAAGIALAVGISAALAGVGAATHAGRSGFVYLDVSDAPSRGALMAVVRHLDAQLGYPRSSTFADGGVAPSPFDTRHATMPIPHPTQDGRWLLPLDANAAAKLLALRAVCRARVDAGVAQGPCLAIAGMGGASATLDDSWSDADSGARSWDAGPNLQPDDDFDGALP